MGGVSGAIDKLLDEIKTKHSDITVKIYNKDNYVKNSIEFKPINLND